MVLLASRVMHPAPLENADLRVEEPVDTGSAARCPFPHAAAAPQPEPARCPFPHARPATEDDSTADDGAVCPFPMRAGGPATRTKADLVVRRILRIRERPAGVTAASAYATFQRSMLISAIRCTLTYVVFPFVLPAVGFATGVGPIVGIVIGVLAMTCDVFTIRRFFAIDHRWRWHFSAVALAVIGLLSVLLVQDIVHLVT